MQAAFAAAVALLIDEKGIAHIGAKQIEPWDVALLLLITGVELYSCIVPVGSKYFENLNSEYASSMWSYFHFNWYTPVINAGYKGDLTVDDLPVLVDYDR